MWQETREAQLYLEIRRKAQPKEKGACGVTGLVEVVRGRQEGCYTGAVGFVLLCFIWGKHLSMLKRQQTIRSF